MKFAFNDKAVVVHIEDLNELNDVAMCLRGKEIYLGNDIDILRIKKISNMIATIRIEGDWEITKKPGT